MMLKNDTLTPQGINVFNAILGNVELRGRFFGNIQSKDLIIQKPLKLKLFGTLISNINNSF